MFQMIPYVGSNSISNLEQEVLELRQLHDNLERDLDALELKLHPYDLDLNEEIETLEAILDEQLHQQTEEDVSEKIEPTWTPGDELQSIGRMFRPSPEQIKDLKRECKKLYLRICAKIHPDKASNVDVKFFEQAKRAMGDLNLPMLRSIAMCIDLFISSSSTLDESFFLQEKLVLETKISKLKDLEIYEYYEMLQERSFQEVVNIRRRALLITIRDLEEQIDA